MRYKSYIRYFETWVLSLNKSYQCYGETREQTCTAQHVRYKSYIRYFETWRAFFVDDSVTPDVRDPRDDYDARDGRCVASVTSVTHV